MTVTTTVNIAIMTGNDITTVFPYNFPIPAQANLFVYLLDATTNEIVSTVNPGDYAVSGLGTAIGGTVVYPLSGSPLDNTRKIMIQRIMAYTQDLDIRNEGGFYPEVVEQQLDDIVMQIQQIAEGLSRSLLFPPGTVGQTLPAAENNTVLGWLAGVLVNIDPTTFINLAGVATAAQGAKADSAVQPGAPFMAALNAIVAILPTSLPASPNIVWNNGGMVSIS